MQRSWFKSGWGQPLLLFLDALIWKRFHRTMDFVQYVYATLFWLAVVAFYFLSHNLFVTLIYLEFAALATGVLLVLRSLQTDDRYFEFFAVCLITLAGAESAIAISLLVNLNRSAGQLNADSFAGLKL
jgi:NADH-ubiquinone oxidoreductase chain 4L